MWDDPLFAVRVVGDSPSFIAQALPFFSSIAGVAVGGWVTYLATVKTERRKFDDETTYLATSIAFEIRASIDMLEKTIRIFQHVDPSFHGDTILYSEPLEDPLPTTRAAAAKVGRFKPEVANLITQVLVHLGGVQQGNLVIRAMARNGALTLEKLGERQAALLPMIEDMRRHGEELVVAIEKNYGTSSPA